MSFPSYPEADLAIAQAYCLHPLTVGAARKLGVLARLLLAVERRMGLAERKAA